MALLTTGNFYSVIFLPTTDAAWAALDPNFPFGLSGELAEAVYKAAPTTVQIYVIDSGQGQIAYNGGQAVGFDDTLVDTSLALTQFTFTDMASVNTIYAKYALGGLDFVMIYDSVAGILRRYEDPAIANFKAFLPT